MPAPPHFLLVDDRGRQLPKISERQAMDAAAQRDAGARTGFPIRRLAWLLWALPVVLVLYSLRTTSALYAVAIGTALVLALVLGVIAVAILPFVIQGMRQSAVLKTIPRHAGWLAAHGCCGACGYTLEGLEAASDGCVTCPECGAAWHAERMTMLGRRPDDPRAQHAIERLRNTSARAADDRGVPLERSLLSPPWGFRSSVQHSTSYREYLEECRRAIPKHFAIALLIFVCLFGGVCFSAMRSASSPILPGLATLALTIIAAPIATLIFRGKLAAQLELVRARRCPHCGDPLSRSPGFDGCTSCGKCGRAWKV